MVIKINRGGKAPSELAGNVLQQKEPPVRAKSEEDRGMRLASPFTLIHSILSSFMIYLDYNATTPLDASVKVI